MKENKVSKTFWTHHARELSHYDTRNVRILNEPHQPLHLGSAQYSCPAYADKLYRLNNLKSVDFSGVPIGCALCRNAEPVAFRLSFRLYSNQFSCSFPSISFMPLRRSSDIHSPS